MGYVLKTLFGLGVMVAVLAGLSYAVAELLPIGTCASGIAKQRPEFRGLADIQYVEVVQTEIGPESYVQLVSTRDGLSPPWTYGPPLDLGGLAVGGAPPKQIDG